MGSSFDRDERDDSRQSMDISLTAALGTGFLLGIRHALDGDHVAAVSAFVSEQRSLARSSLLGTFWGTGHTVALLATGMVMIAFKVTISPAVEKGVDTAVALVVILLGGHVLLRSLSRLSVHRHAHAHDGHAHHHLHVHFGADRNHEHVHLLRLGRRPLLVGFLHGLAGSAALMLLVLATIPSPIAALAYILVFGIGSTAGMLVLSGLIGIPFAITAGRSQRAYVIVQAVAGAATLVFGLVMAFRLTE